MRPKLKEIEYPESDGQPMAETDKHRDTMNQLIEALKIHFADEADVYVSGNLLLYYVEGDPTKCVAPDVFFVRGVPKEERRIFKLWEENRAPQVVFEISSRKTKDEDLQWKKQLYAWLGVTEYFIYDPEYKLKPAFRIFRLRDKQLVEEPVTDKRAISHELGLELVNGGKTLRLFNPQTQTFLPTQAEEAAARRTAEEHAKQAAARAEQAAARAERLAAKLRELGLDPDQV